MRKAYDRERARKLVPLLESITREIAERTRTAAVLLAELESLGDESDTVTAKELDLRAELATQRREARLAMREIESLGCVIDETQPSLVYIPGSDGRIQRGYRWETGETTVRRLARPQPGTTPQGA